MLIAPPLLALSRSNFRYTRYTDARNVQIGCVRMEHQQHGVPTRLIGCISRKLRKCDRNYDESHLRCRAIVLSVLQKPPYILGTVCTVRTDQDNLL